MELSVNPNIKSYVVLDPRINQVPNYEYLIKRPASNYTWFSVNANNVGSSSSTFSFNAPGVKNPIDKAIYILNMLSILILPV